MAEPSEASSVSDWIDQMPQSQSDAAQKLWLRYCSRLIHYAHARLQQKGVPRSVVEADDIAQLVFTAVFRSLCQRRYPELDRDGLWRILVKAAERRVISALRHQYRQKRMPAEKRICSADVLEVELDELIASPIGIATAEQLIGVVAESLGHLPAELTQIAQLKFEGFTNAEIAQTIRKSIPTVERRLHRIRLELQRILSPNDVQ